MTSALRVVTYNLYQGASTIPAYGAESLDGMAEALRRAYATMLRTDFPGRAAGIARDVAEHRPHLVGLQEVARWQDGDQVHDFLEILLKALADAGTPYRVAATVTTPPLGVHTDGRIVSVLDRVALLVRADLANEGITVGATGQQLYTARIELPVPSGLVVTKLRGWAWADLTVGGRPLRAVTTHLEAFDPQVRLAQAAELIDALDAVGTPVLVTGDFNSAPSGEAYQLFAKGSFTDAWACVQGGADGFTGIQSADLSNEDSELYQRVDYVMHRAPGLEPVSVILLGADERLPSGLWASDHAGVLAAFTATG